MARTAICNLILGKDGIIFIFGAVSVVTDVVLSRDLSNSFGSYRKSSFKGLWQHQSGGEQECRKILKCDWLQSVFIPLPYRLMGSPLWSVLLRLLPSCPSVMTSCLQLIFFFGSVDSDTRKAFRCISEKHEFVNKYTQIHLRLSPVLSLMCLCVYVLSGIGASWETINKTELTENPILSTFQSLFKFYLIFIQYQVSNSPTA